MSALVLVSWASRSFDNFSAASSQQLVNGELPRLFGAVLSGFRGHLHDLTGFR